MSVFCVYSVCVAYISTMHSVIVIVLCAAVLGILVFFDIDTHQRMFSDTMPFGI